MTAPLSSLAPLPRSFFNRDPRLVARELLGKLLVRRQSSLLLAGRIVEAEAYLGLADPGAHAYRGPTARNAVLFGPAGHAYVYFIYGNHYCTNVSCQPEGEAGCVLLRALEPVCGIAEMAARRGLALSPGDSGRSSPGRRVSGGGAQPGSAARPDGAPPLAELRRLTSGPGRLSEALGITRPRDNGKDLCSTASDLFLASDGDGLEPEFAGAVVATARINVSRAPREPWRYVVSGNPFVSGPRTKQD